MPRRCLPDFVNAAFERPVEASSTCGNPASRHCLSNDVTRSSRTCLVCDQLTPKRRHPAAFLTDLNNPTNITCWISEPLYRQSQQNVTLTLALGKKFEVQRHTNASCLTRAIAEWLACGTQAQYGLVFNRSRDAVG